MLHKCTYMCIRSQPATSAQRSTVYHCCLCAHAHEAHGIRLASGCGVVERQRARAAPPVLDILHQQEKYYCHVRTCLQNAQRQV